MTIINIIIYYLFYKLKELTVTFHYDYTQYKGSCGSGGGLSTNQKVGGSIPGSPSPHVKVVLGKLLNPKLLPKAVPSVCVYE